MQGQYPKDNAAGGIIHVIGYRPLYDKRIMS